MNDDGSKELLKFFTKREVELHVEQKAFEIWLGVLEPFGAFSKICGIAFPLIAGFTLLSQPKFLGENWEIISGSLSLIAAILTGIHTGLKCDDHQAECRRLITAFKSLVEDYQYQKAKVVGKTEDVSKLNIRLEELEKRRKDLRESITARPARWCTQCAKKDLGVVNY